VGGCFDRFDSPKGMLVLHVSLDDAVHRICSPFPANLKLELSGEKILRHDNKRKAQKPSKNSPDLGAPRYSSTRVQTPRIGST
jgi:hypothetical protein